MQKYNFEIIELGEMHAVVPVFMEGGAGGVAEAVCDFVSDTVEGVCDFIGDSCEDLWEGISDNFLSLSLMACGGPLGFAIGAYDLMSDDFDLEETLEDAWEDVCEVCEDAWEGICDIWDEWKNEIIMAVAIIASCWIPGVNAIVAGAVIGALQAGMESGWDIGAMAVGAVGGALSAYGSGLTNIGAKMACQAGASGLEAGYKSDWDLGEMGEAAVVGIATAKINSTFEANGWSSNAGGRFARDSATGTLNSCQQNGWNTDSVVNGVASGAGKTVGGMASDGMGMDSQSPTGDMVESAVSQGSSQAIVAAAKGEDVGEAAVQGMSQGAVTSAANSISQQAYDNLPEGGGYDAMEEYGKIVTDAAAKGISSAVTGGDFDQTFQANLKSNVDQKLFVSYEDRLAAAAAEYYKNEQDVSSKNTAEGNNNPVAPEDSDGPNPDTLGSNQNVGNSGSTYLSYENLWGDMTFDDDISPETAEASYKDRQNGALDMTPVTVGNEGLNSNYTQHDGTNTLFSDLDNGSPNMQVIEAANEGQAAVWLANEQMVPTNMESAVVYETQTIQHSAERSVLPEQIDIVSLPEYDQQTSTYASNDSPNIPNILTIDKKSNEEIPGWQEGWELVDTGSNEHSSASGAMDYLGKSLNQLVKGNYTEDVTLLGTAAQVGTGLLGVDLPGDIRDLTHDITNWEWSWGHAGKTLLDGVGLLPVVGSIKYVDEAGALLKSGEKYDIVNDIEKSVGTGFIEAGEVASKSSVWKLDPKLRGSTIESQLAETDYKDWFNVGQLDNGKFPLVDFQKGNNLVSLKSVDTAGETWLGRMQEHIADLGSRGATVDGKTANMILDLRVQPGGSQAAQSLIEIGQKHGVTVIIKEF